MPGPADNNPAHLTGYKNRQWLWILSATLFNLLFEYSGRGINNLFQMPFLLPVLFCLYFSLFTMIDDVIVRFRLRDYHFLILAFFYGTIYQFFASGSVFFRPGVLGIDWVALIFINLVMWASLQGVLTFYFATRLFPRGPHTPLLGEQDWIIALVVNFIALVLIHIGGNIPAPKFVPLCTGTVIIIIAALAFRRQVKKVTWRSAFLPFRKSNVLDLVCLFSIALFLVNGLVLVHDPVQPYTTIYNATAWRIDLVWAVSVALILLIYRLIKGEPIPV